MYPAFFPIICENLINVHLRLGKEKPDDLVSIYGEHRIDLHIFEKKKHIWQYLDYYLEGLG